MDFRKRLKRQRKLKNRNPTIEEIQTPEPDQPRSIKDVVTGTMSIPDKIGAALSIRWLKREVPKALKEARMEGKKLVVDESGKPTKLPTRKVVMASSGGGSFALLIIAIMGWFGIEVDPEEAVIVSSALAFAFGWFFKNGSVS